MNTEQFEFEKSPMTKSIFAGLFAGFIATIVCLAYNYAYRDITEFAPSSIFNVSSIIFGVLILSVLAGLVYYLFTSLFKKGTLVFTILFIALALIILNRIRALHSDGSIVSLRGGLGLGIGLIMCLLVALLIPYFSKHSREYI